MLLAAIALTPCILFATVLGHGPHDGGHPQGHHPAPTEPLTVTQRTVLGTAPMKYESVPGWCQLPDEQPLGNTHGGIVIDDAGLVYYNTDTARAIMVHAADGTFKEALAPELAAIHSMQLRRERQPDGTSEQFIYAAHLAGKQVVKLKLDGTIIWSFGVPLESGKYDDNPASYNPTSIAVAPNGHLFVADGYGRNWIHQFDADRKYLRSIGGPGCDPGTFQTCHGLTIDTRGDGEATLLVCDRENRRIQRFSLDGEFLEVVATDLRRPCALSIWGEYTAVAELEGRVTILDGAFQVVAHLGDNADATQWANNGVTPEKWSDGVFTAPHAVCFDRAGNLYVMDWNAHGRISKLRLIKDVAH